VRDRLFARGEVVSGQYEVRDLLGGGSMGQVYEAHDLALNRRVALKAAFPHLDRALIRREAQCLAAVRHHGVVSVHTIGEHQGVPYFVMERLYGVSLEDHMNAVFAEGELLTIAEALAVLVPLADVLAAVHAAGVAHRDVKPANVMLVVGERVVLTDFGVVAPEFSVVSGLPVVGTLEYMAPETIAGTTSPGDAFLVDMYAFGALAFELVAGRCPFEAETPRELLDKHLREVAPSLADERDDVPPLFAGLVRELLAKDPLDRPHTMAAVARRLRDPAMRQMSALRSSPPEGSRITLPPSSVKPTETTGHSRVTSPTKK
jgi:serine/threonine-protein kinase